MASELMKLPVCPANAEHGQLHLREGKLTKEQEFCGTWYDCGENYCKASVLLKSPALMQQLQEPTA